MQQVNNILIRLPNWLGDMVMGTAFLQAVQQQYPNANIDVIAKKGIDLLLDYFPPHNNRYVFDKTAYKGLKGAYSFGKKIGHKKKYDLFFCLPNSFSSALMGYATGATKRIGYKKELRSFLLTHSYSKSTVLHRVQEYLQLLSYFINKESLPALVKLNGKKEKKETIVININSEATSRRLPIEKAVSIINTIRKKFLTEIILMGGPADADFTNTVFNQLENKTGITNMAGLTTIHSLISCLNNAAVVLSTDSGPAHVSNALGTNTVVLFGAGNENNTSPYNKNHVSVIRLGKLACEPCIKNVCKKYGVPQCLLQLDELVIVNEIKKYLSN